MADTNLKILNADGDEVFIKETGAGTDLDPNVPHQIIDSGSVTVASVTGLSKGAGTTDASTLRVITASDGPMNAVLGTTSGSAVVSDSNGSIQQFLRGLVKIFADMWDSTNHLLKVVGVAKSGVNYSSSLPATYKLTLTADTDASVDVPAGITFMYVFHALATPVHCALATVTLPVANSGTSQHTMMCCPNSGTAYKVFATPTADGTTYDMHVRSASAGDVWVTFTDESLT